MELESTDKAQRVRKTKEELRAQQRKQQTAWCKNTEKGKAYLKAKKQRWAAKNSKRLKKSKKAWYLKNKDRLTNKNLHKLYKIAPGQFDLMLAEQKGACAICGVVPAKGEKRLVVDHDHKTGIVRGLLCSRCNLGIGQLKENLSLLVSAAKYLILHRKYP